jgi:hypothetical protein
MAMLIDLSNVTLCAVGSNDRVLAARALEICRAQCNFADSILFSHEPVPGSFRNVKINRPQSMTAYTAFMLKELHKFITTDFVLVTQWDGYVVNPGAWRSEFLQYDYIGATWPWKEDNLKVGNGGFSLRSKRLLDVVAQPWFDLLPNLGEDELICRVYRPILENQLGIRFAPPEVADRFAYERAVHLVPTFGFHGMFNFWREVPDADLIQMIPHMPLSAFHHVHCAELTATYYVTQRWRPLRALYSAWRSHHSLEDIRNLIAPAIPPEFLPHFIQTCESLFQIV